ncbi:MAG: hypothetical protein WCR52_13245 [Bacteroidota bacterium]
MSNEALRRALGQGITNIEQTNIEWGAAPGFGVWRSAFFMAKIPSVWLEGGIYSA